MNAQYTEKPPSYNETTRAGQPDENEISTTTISCHVNNESAHSALIPHQVAVTQPQVVVVQLRPDQTKVPCVVQCPKCNRVVTSKVTMVSGSYANLCCCLICCLGGGGCCLCLIPYCNDYFMDAEHRCPVCNNFLGVCKP